MLTKLRTNALNNLPVIVLILITLYICAQNYTPSTFLTGWDTLHPEFDYKIYWHRMLGGAWQEHQGLGAVASQAHAAEIPRVIVLMLLDIFLALNNVRYAYAFLMLILGPVGIYYFFKKGIFSKGEFKPSFIEAASFSAGLFYLLNLITVQHFYIPLEMFLTHYGFLGFFMLGVVKLLNGITRKRLIYFTLVTFFMVPQAHTSTLFFALIASLLAFSVFYWFANNFQLVLLKRFGIVFGLLLAVNLFWLLPNLYFAATNGKLVQESKIHRLFNEEAFLQNKAFGDIENIPLGKGFLFNWGEHAGNLQFEFLLDEWMWYHSRPGVLILGYGLFIAVLLGGVYVAFQKNAKLYGVFGIFLLSIFFLLNVNPPTGFIYIFLQEHLPFFKEAFRFPFTKYSITLAFANAVLFGVFVLGGLQLASRLLQARVVFSKILPMLVSFGMFIWLSLWMRPVYQGGLISPSMRVAIPERYFRLFDYLEAQEGYGRVANLPIHTFWGWVYHSWEDNMLGYQGAGFLWFGIKQPLLDREFDRWNITNQNYYADMTRAVYAQESYLLIETLEKYKIRWLLFDGSIVAPGQNQKILFKEELAKLLTSTNSLILAKDFGNNLKLYEYVPGREFKEQEVLPTKWLTIDEGGYVFGNIEQLSEELDTNLVKTDATQVTFTTRATDLNFPHLATVYLPFDVYARQDAGSINLRFESRLHTDSVGFEAVFPAAVAKTPILSLNGNFVTISSLNSEFTKLTYLLLPAWGSWELLVYDSATPGEPIDIDTVYTNLDVCSDIGEHSAYSIVRNPTGFVLTGKNATACLTANLAKVLGRTLEVQPTSQSVMQLSVRGAFAEEPCILNELTALCENRPIAKGKTVFKVVQPLDKYNLRFYAQGINKAGEVANSYSAIELATLVPVYRTSIELPAEFFESFEQVSLTQNISFDKALGFGGKVSELASFPRYCKNNELVQSTGTFESGFIYKTSDDEICDTFQFPLASHTTGQVLEIRARNISGIPLRVCLTNEYSKRCDKYVELPRDSALRSYLYLIPPMGSTNGYVVNISNVSFGGMVSENELEYIWLTPVSYDLVKRLRSGHPEEKTVFVYNEAFEKGWQALCGFRLCDAEHVRVNGWANGWIFDDESVGVTKVFFWPQLLEYVGFVMLAVLLVAQHMCFRCSRLRGLRSVEHTMLRNTPQES